MSQRPKLRILKFDDPIVASPDEPDRPVTAILEQLAERRERMLAALALACTVSLRRSVNDLRLYTTKTDAGYTSLYWFEARPTAPETAPDGDVNAHVARNFQDRFGFAPHEAALAVQVAHDAINVGIVRKPEVDREHVREVEELPEDAQ